MAKTGLAPFITDCTRILVAMEANAADFPHMEAEQQELRTLITELIELSTAQAAQNAAAQQTTKDLNEKLDRAKVLFAQMRSAVKAKYSTRSEKLTEFFLKPLGGKRAAAALAAARKTTQETPAPTTPDIIT